MLSLVFSSRPLTPSSKSLVICLSEYAPLIGLLAGSYVTRQRRFVGRGKRQQKAEADWAESNVTVGIKLSLLVKTLMRSELLKLIIAVSMSVDVIPLMYIPFILNQKESNNAPQL
jgi:hypothetical protein